MPKERSPAGGLFRGPYGPMCGCDDFAVVE
jgi:hypothetical protein